MKESTLHTLDNVKEIHIPAFQLSKNEVLMSNPAKITTQNKWPLQIRSKQIYMLAGISNRSLWNKTVLLFCCKKKHNILYILHIHIFMDETRLRVTQSHVRVVEGSETRWTRHIQGASFSWRRSVCQQSSIEECRSNMMLYHKGDELHLFLYRRTTCEFLTHLINNSEI